MEVTYPAYSFDQESDLMARLKSRMGRPILHPRRLFSIGEKSDQSQDSRSHLQGIQYTELKKLLNFRFSSPYSLPKDTIAT